MKPRWLLLAVSVICLLVLAPAAALSQQPVLDLGCGTATIDGRVGPVEWANAATVTLFEEEQNKKRDASPEGAPFGQVAPAQPPREIGTAYFMHDEVFLYVGAILGDPDERVPNNPTDYALWLTFAFEDEPAGSPAAWTDCAWEAESCEQPEDEGQLFGASNTWSEDEVGFNPWAAPHQRCDSAPLSGVTFKAAPRGGGGHYEMRVNLGTSPLNNVGVGDCFDLRWIWVYLGGERPNGWRSMSAGWPLDPVDNEPYTGECTILCLEPCEVEFVPEPATILLFGSGLAGLAGYATLHWRNRE